jgi:uncharacterized protein YkwD
VPRTPAQALGFLTGLWLAVWLLQPLAVRADDAGDRKDLEAALLDSVNRVRADHHLVPLRRDPMLDAVARAHSRDMALRGFLAHETPEGVNPVGRLDRGGVTGFSLAGENIGLTNRGDPNREIVVGWLESPVHRENLLAPFFNTTGIGIAVAPSGALYYTQVYVTFPRNGRGTAALD